MTLYQIAANQLSVFFVIFHVGIIMQEQEIERLIRISVEKPLLPEVFIPWNEEPGDADLFLPEVLTTLQGLPLYDTLSATQKQELGRHEAVQVMYSYAWGEALFCVFMTKYARTLSPESAEHRFLLRELIEEYRHQEMFGRGIKQLKGEPLKQHFLHRFIGKLTTNCLPADFLFMGSISIELVTDVYGDYTRRTPGLYIVLKKIFELHSIEEGRHIHFTKGLLQKYTANAGYVKRSLYSLVILMNIVFLRTMYLRQEIYERIGLQNAPAIYRMAGKNYQSKFRQYCLTDIVEFVNSWKGFNTATRWAWRLALGVKN